MCQGKEQAVSTGQRRYPTCPEFAGKAIGLWYNSKKFNELRMAFMDVALVTGSAGLIGSESVKFLAKKGFSRIVGVDNDMRSYFFGKEASTGWNLKNIQDNVPSYIHYDMDIRSDSGMKKIFTEFNTDIKLIVHTAAQPSHDWARKNPICDFTVNANGTLLLLEMTRKYCPDAVFIFTSTNKVYGDSPNFLPLVELETRWEIDNNHKFFKDGIDESMSIDNTMHSLFGASKVAADILVQEYGRYFGLKTVCFRAGCLTGPNHSGAQLHGFLAYLMKCLIDGRKYTVFGYKGKQVRDNIHSSDFVNMFWHFYKNPKKSEVYNAGGGRHSNCSILEAIQMSEEMTGKKLNWTYSKAHRKGDHIWYISNMNKFRKDYPQWEYKYDLRRILEEIRSGVSKRK
jgi:CDP-paratose 2-epimerase